MQNVLKILVSKRFIIISVVGVALFLAISSDRETVTPVLNVWNVLQPVQMVV